MTDLSPETVGKLVALVRDMDKYFGEHGVPPEVGHHYRSATALVAGTSDPVDANEALVSRMKALMQSMARVSGDYLPRPIDCVEHYAEARAIDAELPEPVDPDTHIAAEIVAAHFPDGTYYESGRVLAAGDRS